MFLSCLILLINQWISIYWLSSIIWKVLVRWLDIVYQINWILVVSLLLTARYNCAKWILALIFRFTFSLLEILVYLLHTSNALLICRFLKLVFIFCSFILLISLMKWTLIFIIPSMILWTTYSYCCIGFCFISAFINIIEFIIMISCDTYFSWLLFQ
jgi:hypothetical protein